MAVLERLCLLRFIFRGFDRLIEDLQRAGGAVLCALAAGRTDLDRLFALEFRLDDRIKATPHQAQQALADDLIADPDALVAQDALALVALDDRQALLGIGRVILAHEPLRVDGGSVSKLD